MNRTEEFIYIQQISGKDLGGTIITEQIFFDTINNFIKTTKPKRSFTIIIELDPIYQKQYLEIKVKQKCKK